MLEKNAVLLFLQNWMTLLRDSIAHKPLTSLLIPGSHDSNTHDLHGYQLMKAFSVCQNLDVYQQLRHGVRFLDLRYAPGDGTNVINRHGIVKGGDFITNIVNIRRFLDEHPYEFVIVYLEQMRKMRPENSETLLAAIAEHLGGYMVTKRDMETWFQLDKTTLGEIWHTKKRIFMINRDLLFEDPERQAASEELGIMLAHVHYHSFWHNVTDIELLIEGIRQHLSTRQVHNSKLFASQCVLTPQASVIHNVKALFKRRVHSISKLVESLFDGEEFVNFILDNTHSGLNILMFDMVEYKLKLIEAIIAANIETRLVVHQAILDEMYVTEKVADAVKADRFLYIESLRHMLRGYHMHNSKLTVLYSFNNRPLEAAVVTQKDREVLIFDNPMNKIPDEASFGEYLDKHLLTFQNSLGAFRSDKLFWCEDDFSRMQKKQQVC